MNMYVVLLFDSNQKGKEQPLKSKKTSTTPSCSGPIPAQKIRGNSVAGGVISINMDDGGPEMKCTYFHRNCWKRIA